MKTKPCCRHGLTDEVEITDKTVVEDYRHRTRSTIYGYWCREHQAFGNYTIRHVDVEFPARESTAPKV